MKPRIAYTWSESVVCGGTIVPAMHVRLLNEAGIEADIYADNRSAVLEEFAGREIRPRALLRHLRKEDILVNVWYPTTSEEDALLPKRKIQLVQGNDAKQYENVEMKENVFRIRNKPNWEILAVSKYAGDWLKRPYTLIPNGVHERFLKEDWPKERDIDVLIEGNDEPNKNIPYAISLAKEAGANNIVWLGRDTRPVPGVHCITNPRQDEIPGLYARSKCFLKLSHSEGFCLPILEAFACGALVVTWPMGGNDFCKDKGNCVSSDDYRLKVEAIAGIIEGRYPEQFETIRKAARWTAESYSWESVKHLLVPFFLGPVA